MKITQILLQDGAKFTKTDPGDDFDGWQILTFVDEDGVASEVKVRGRRAIADRPFRNKRMVGLIFPGEEVPVVEAGDEIVQYEARP